MPPALDPRFIQIIEMIPQRYWIQILEYVAKKSWPALKRMQLKHAARTSWSALKRMQLKHAARTSWSALKRMQLKHAARTPWSTLKRMQLRHAARFPQSALRRLRARTALAKPDHRRRSPPQETDSEVWEIPREEFEQAMVGGLHRMVECSISLTLLFTNREGWTPRIRLREWKVR